MPDAPVLSPTATAGASKKVKLKESAFGAGFHGPLVHQSVRAEQAARRRGTAATKTRGMVSGGGAKPWRQKGTGRARAGSSRSPLWTGGGVVFGPQPRSYTFKVNRKEQRAAFRSASLAARRTRIDRRPRRGLLQGAQDERGVGPARGWDQPQPTLVVLAAEERAAALSFRNLERVAVLTPRTSASPTWWAPLRSLSPRPRSRSSQRARPVPDEGAELMEPTQVIIKPVVSEKTYVLSAVGKYTFRVHPDAHRTQIRQAVEALFDVKVVDVRTMSVKAKPKRRGITRGSTRALGRRRSSGSLPAKASRSSSA